MGKDKLNIFYLILFVTYILGGSVAILFSYYSNFNREGIGIALLFGTILSYFLYSRRDEINIKAFSLKMEYFKILSIFYVLLSLLAFLISFYLTKNYYLPIEFFIIVSVIASIITIQTLFFKNLSKFQTYSILIEIFVMSLLLFSSFLFLFPSPYGNDSAYHIGLINQILLTASFGNYLGHYSNYSIFHVLFVSIMYITGISDFKIVQLILGFIITLFLTFIFILVSKYSNVKIALISVLLLSASPYILESQYSYFPMTFSVIFFILGLYLFLNLYRGSMMVLLFILAFFTLNISHPLTPFFFIMIALLIVIVSNQMKFNKRYLSLTGFFLLVLLLLIWWTKPIPGATAASQSNLLSMLLYSIKNAMESVDVTAVSRVTLSTSLNLYLVTLYDLGWIILSFLGILGAFYGIKRFLITRKPKNEILIFFVITLILIPIPYVLAMVYPQSAPDRWFPFIGLFVAISASFAVWAIFNSPVKNRLKYVLVVLLIFTAVFFTITTPIANPNSQIYSNVLSSRSALTYSEIDAGNFIFSYSNQNIKGSSLFLSLLSQSANANNFIDPSNSSTFSSGGTLVVRNYDLQNGFTIPLFGAQKNQFEKNVMPDRHFIGFLTDSNEIYNNGNLQMYNLD